MTTEGHIIVGRPKDYTTMKTIRFGDQQSIMLVTCKRCGATVELTQFVDSVIIHDRWHRDQRTLIADFNKLRSTVSVAIGVIKSLQKKGR